MTELDKKNLTLLLKEANTKKTDICKEILRIKEYTILNKITLFDDLFYMIRRTKKGFSLKKDDKKYEFTLLSDENIQEIDKKMLKRFSQRQGNNAILRILKLASSKKFIDTKVIIASTNDLNLTALIEFTRDNKRMIIDYVNNIVMEKDKYNELFEVKVINTIDEVDLYKIWKLWQEYDFSLYYLLFYTKEIFENLEKNIPQFEEQYKCVSDDEIFIFSDEQVILRK